MRGRVTSVGGTDWSRLTRASTSCTPGATFICKSVK